MKYKYCDNDRFKDFTYEALSSQFQDRQSFESFYSSLKDSKTKDNFLRVGSLYLFFVKKGSWNINDSEYESSEYFTNSFKLVAIIGIIESLSDNKHIEFFQWLTKKENKQYFPIENKEELDIPYRKYKLEHGAINRCKSFFINLPKSTKDKLCSLITTDGEPMENIEDVVKLIYTARSDFAHECNFVLKISNGSHYTKKNNKLIIWKFPMDYLQSVVEEGIVIFFKDTQE